MLDKAHFSECYVESMITEHSFRAYFKAIILALIAIVLLFVVQADPYISWFIVALSALEALAVYYHKPWWLTRQMLSKAAGSKITLTLNEQSITSKSFYGENILLWQNLSIIKKTAQGWLLSHQGGKYYISSQCLSGEAEDFLAKQAKKLVPVTTSN